LDTALNFGSAVPRPTRNSSVEISPKAFYFFWLRFFPRFHAVVSIPFRKFERTPNFRRMDLSTHFRGVDERKIERSYL
jgi:hypothetical protein